VLVICLDWYFQNAAGNKVGNIGALVESATWVAETTDSLRNVEQAIMTDNAGGETLAAGPLSKTRASCPNRSGSPAWVPQCHREGVEPANRD